MVCLSSNPLATLWQPFGIPPKVALTGIPAFLSACCQHQWGIIPALLGLSTPLQHQLSLAADLSTRGSPMPYVSIHECDILYEIWFVMLLPSWLLLFAFMIPCSVRTQGPCCLADCCMDMCCHQSSYLESLSMSSPVATDACHHSISR